VEVKVDGYEAYNGFDPKQRRGPEHTENPDSGSPLHIVENSKQI